MRAAAVASEDVDDRCLHSDGLLRLESGRQGSSMTRRHLRDTVEQPHGLLFAGLDQALPV